MRGTDNRKYRIYIRYEWDGDQYLAKSYRAYSTAKFFPGDTVSIWVNKDDKKKLIKFHNPNDNWHVFVLKNTINNRP